MSDLRLNALGTDLDLTNGKLTIISDAAEALAQKLSIGLSVFVGEWFLNLRSGVPYHGRILVSGVNEADIYAIFRSFILNTKGVSGFSKDVSIDFSGTRTSRTIRVTATAITATGEAVTIDTGAIDAV